MVKKENKKRKAESMKVIAKVSPVEFTLNQGLNDQAFKHVPAYAAKAATNDYKTLKALLEEAKKIAQSETPAALSKTFAEITTTVTNAISSSDLLQSHLQLARKHSCV